MSFLNINSNDDAIAFFRENGYPTTYNDGLLAYLRDVYPIPDGGRTLPDLLSRYLRDYGETFNMIIAGKSAVAQSIIEPAATFITTTPTDSGTGTTVLTSAGTHGLTSAVAVGHPIYISDGTNWIPGFYTITAIDLDTTGVAITINYPFSVSLGTPTIALANTLVVLGTVSIPALEANSLIRVDTTFTSPDTSATNKSVRVRLESTSFYANGLTTLPNNGRVTVIQNRGATNSQIARVASNGAAGEGNSATVPTTGSVDTSVETIMTFTAQPATANIPIVLERYFVEVFK